MVFFFWLGYGRVYLIEYRDFQNPTANENKICGEVTWERIKRVSKGYKKPNGEKVEGLGGNIKYLKTDFIKKDKSIDDLKEKRHKGR